MAPSVETASARTVNPPERIHRGKFRRRTRVPSPWTIRRLNRFGFLMVVPRVADHASPNPTGEPHPGFTPRHGAGIVRQALQHTIDTVEWAAVSRAASAGLVLVIRPCPSKSTPSSTTITGAATSPKTRAVPFSSTRSVACTLPTSSPLMITVPARSVALTPPRSPMISVSVEAISPWNFPFSMTVPLNVYFPSISDPSSMNAVRLPRWADEVRFRCQNIYGRLICCPSRFFSTRDTGRGPFWASASLSLSLILMTLPLKKPPLEITRESVSILPLTRPVAAISTLPVATMLPSYWPMMMASTVLTSAVTTPFWPITSLPPTFSSPPTSHSIWIESAISNLPSIRAWSPTTVRRVAGMPGWPLSVLCWLPGRCVLLRPNIAASFSYIGGRWAGKVRFFWIVPRVVSTPELRGRNQADLAPERALGVVQRVALPHGLAAHRAVVAVGRRHHGRALAPGLPAGRLQQVFLPRPAPAAVTSRALAGWSANSGTSTSGTPAASAG